MTRALVTVDGVDGSGKTTLARELVRRLARAGLEALRVGVDDFRRAVDWAAGDETALYYERYFGLEAIGAVLRSFAADQPTLTLPSFDEGRGIPGPDRVVTAGSDAVLVLEGVFIRRVAFPRIPVAHLYLAVPPDEARERLVARDVARGRSRAEVVRRLDRRYVPGQRRYHAECAPRDRADMVLECAGPLAWRTVRAEPNRLAHRVAQLLA
ncbi:MAG TPA: hypothetical protein VNJ71_01550 [Gemmatimonadales bacterium]|jgi:uridine kinase|nr:hypothetical protein [Gemmatimonadales bacterium]